MEQYSFEKLDVWKVAMDLAEETYRFTEQLPNDERFGLVSQMRRCAISIPSNIAEGQGRGSFGEVRQFTRHALGALSELQTQCHLCRRIFGFESASLNEMMARVRSMLRKLYLSVKEDVAPYNLNGESSESHVAYGISREEE